VSLALYRCLKINSTADMKTVQDKTSVAMVTLSLEVFNSVSLAPAAGLLYRSGRTGIDVHLKELTTLGRESSQGIQPIARVFVGVLSTVLCTKRTK
jgi:hypothetical protein